jgi:LPPG:FO 2-phospho-L-lactate transferase
MNLARRRLGVSLTPPCRNRFGRDGIVSVDVKVTVLVGGVGGARFLLGVQRLLGLGRFSGQPNTRQFSF